MQAIMEAPRGGLDPAQLDSLRQELEQELLFLTAGSGGAEGGTALLEVRSQARARAVLAALARMRDGNYGICRRCGGAIPYARLAAIPETTTCVACAQGKR